MINGQTKIVGVFGDPIAHTKSPLMHNTAFQKLSMNTVYLPFRVQKTRLKESVLGLRALNFLGANVTLPHKETVGRFLDHVSKESRLIGAVNTIVNTGGRLSGTTTDPYGILMALKKGAVSFRKKAITILGTGGAARTALFTFLLQRERDIAIAARRPERAAPMVRRAKAEYGLKIPVLPLKSQAFSSRASETGLLINCTPVGMSPKAGVSPVSCSLLPSGATVFDMVYNPVRTKLLTDAKKRGLKTVSGLLMLIYQGIASFKLWTGKTPAFSLYQKAVGAHA